MKGKRNAYIAIVGGTGVGKTTLAELLLGLGFHHLKELNENNSFLADFYASGMKKFALHSQLFFLLRKWALLAGIRSLLKTVSVAVDPDSRVDINMYEEALWRMGSLSPAEHDLYQWCVELVMRDLPEPDLVIYCRVSVETLLACIETRSREEEGREMEQTITPEYLALQIKCLERWLFEEHDGPLLVLDFEKLDITTPEGAQIALDQVQQFLRINRFAI